jgi:MFS transporter, ACS family, glucarate transporter
MAVSRDPEDELVANLRNSAPSRIRLWVLAFTVTLAAITYLDRVCIAHADVSAAIKAELRISDKQMGWVYSAFTLAYALFEMPTGAWGDRIGTRRVLTRIVVWWSTFTIATAAAFNYASLLLIRFLFGAGEAGAFPNVTRTFSRWFPMMERGRAQGVFFAGAHLGGGLTPMLVTVLLGVLPWRGVFILLGSVGFVWALAWYVWFRDEPEEHPDVNQEELTHIQTGRASARAKHRLDSKVLGRILTNRNLIALCLMYFTQAYGFYFNITWLPTYLARRGLTVDKIGIWAGVLAGLPLILSSLADVTGGWTTDALSRRLGLRIGRCGVGMVSLIVAGVALIVGANLRSPLASALLIALSGAGASFLLASCWGVCQDIAGPHAGLVAGCMNTAGQVGAFLSPIILPYFKNPLYPLCIAGGLYLAGACCWLTIDPRKPIDVESDEF